MPDQQNAPGVCDSCGKQYAWKPQLAGKTVPCKCGGSVSFTGQGAAPAPAFPGRPGPRVTSAAAQDEQKRAEIKKIVTIAVALVALVGILIGAKFAFKAFSKDGSDNLPGWDGEVARMIKDDGAHEVLEWLGADSKRGVVGFKWSNSRLEAKAKEWYSDGAKKVLAFGGFMTASLAIELPDDKDKRTHFFDYADEFRAREAPANPQQVDVGQKYVVLYFMNPPAKFVIPPAK
jgi:hypothetical protein